MNISLTSHFEKFVADSVKSGRYGSSSEVVREALRLLEDRDLQLAALRMELAKGRADLEEGRVKAFDPDSIKQSGRKILANK
jgi:antitoxin ParD1/3/4